MNSASEFGGLNVRENYVLAVRPNIDLWGKLRGWDDCNGLIYRANGGFDEASHEFLNRFFDRDEIDQAEFCSDYGLRALGDFFVGSKRYVERLENYFSNNLFPFRTGTEQQAKELIRELKDNPYMYASIEMQRTFQESERK